MKVSELDSESFFAIYSNWDIYISEIPPIYGCGRKRHKTDPEFNSETCKPAFRVKDPNFAHTHSLPPSIRILKPLNPPFHNTTLRVLNGAPGVGKGRAHF